MVSGFLSATDAAKKKHKTIFDKYRSKDSTAPTQQDDIKVEEEVNFDGGIFSDDSYSCPYCGNTSIVKCGQCGRVCCNKTGSTFFRCVCGHKEYSYLFWEATGNTHYEIKQGYVVHRDELVDFLREKLAMFGLMPREYNEFIVYWYPILCKNEYNAISFFCEEHERDFELSIEPKPDEILRVFMIYQEADKNTVLEPPIEPSPIRRKGFTVIEWGGQLQK